MHLKNFSVIRRDLKVELSPVYDLLNSTIILNSQEELALPLGGKKNKLRKDDFFVYLAKECLELTQKSIDQTVSRIVNVFPKWADIIQKCFLPDSMKTQYIDLFKNFFGVKTVPEKISLKCRSSQVAIVETRGRCLFATEIINASPTDIKGKP